MTNRIDVDEVNSSDPVISRFSRQVVQALRTLDTAFRGAFEAASFLWIPPATGRRGPARFEGVYTKRTTDATQTRVFEYLLRDNAESKIEIRTTGRSTGNDGYSTNLEVVYKRNGTSVAIVGGGSATKTNEREDTAGFDFSVTTVTVNNDVYLVGLVTGAASTRMDWSTWLTVWEQPSLP